LQVVLLLAVAAKDDALAVGREERPAVVAAGRIGQLPDIAAVGVHDVELEVLLAGAIRAEDDVPAVGRIGTLGVVTLGCRERLEPGAVEIRFVDVHERIEIPDIAATLLGLLLLVTELAFKDVVLLSVGVGVAAGEDDLLAVGMKVAARGLADAGA